ncbi:MAG: alkaline phosphatase, partial [Hyphomicrobiaceae bacterium]
MSGRIIVAACLAGLLTSAAGAQTIYPLDRAEILAGARFDLKVELPGKIAGPDAVVVTINGRHTADVLRTGDGGKATFTFEADEEGQGYSALWVRDASIVVPGDYKVEVTHGEAKATVRWEVFDSPPPTA